MKNSNSILRENGWKTYIKKTIEIWNLERPEVSHLEYHSNVQNEQIGQTVGDGKLTTHIK